MPKSDISHADLIRVIQRFVAVEAVGPSAVRGQGPGVLASIQGYLGRLRLAGVPHSRREFEDWLNGRTRWMLAVLSEKVDGRPWGTARKAVNLFLRTCLYNHYVREEYGLKRTEEWLEIPLDSVVAKALKREAGRGGLPPWPGLKRLTPEVSKRFQAFAEDCARSRGLPARVFLDNYLWLANR